MRLTDALKGYFWPVLVCCGVAMNAVCAGGVYAFPLIAPSLVEHLKLSQPQLTSISLAGMISQYPVAAIVGLAIDNLGTWSCSLAASVMFAIGYGVFAREVAAVPPGTHASAQTVNTLIFCWALIGLATVCTGFALVFSATKAFYKYIGVAVGLSQAAFGMSPLLLSLIASHFTPSGETLDLPSYFTFLALFAGIANLTSCVLFRGAQNAGTIPMGSSKVAPTRSDGEPLLLGLALWMTFVVGSSEMVFSNLGSVVLSLPSASRRRFDDRQRRARRPLLALANTLSRLAVGPLADAVAPVATQARTARGRLAARGRHRGAYGTTFTLIPGIMSSIGAAQPRRNYGILSYTAFVGTSIFSFITQPSPTATFSRRRRLQGRRLLECDGKVWKDRV
ncbi:MFS general substrate transporter [Epithele typhae]|uniref:MFS general substrate transporter n=1 Tax=Epithele typhae TaxID=378194 RepID=UPI002008AE09|nr:MFS general substrate transporter [Epithele typhae]KAH9945987.1 MFS general substrate transporter [Epithele typhae]